MPHIFSVSELTQSIKNVLESKFPLIWVKGQISNFSLASSGHIYFTLKDEQACLEAVWFKSYQFDKSLRNSLENGQEVVCAGKLNVYPPQGRYQIIVELIQKAGLGQLHLAFEQLKQKLDKQGLFDPKWKKEIPYNPYKVGVITAQNSAAWQDFLKVSAQYGLDKEIILYPCSVQGEQSIGQIVRAIQLANKHAYAQVLVLIRGGGSLEDLWSFNTEEVARAIFESKLPIVTGIGHEIDTTIADLVADKRASTPSHVPQVLWPAREYFYNKLLEVKQSLWLAIDRYLENKENNLEQLQAQLNLLSPDLRLRLWQERFERIQRELQNSLSLFLDKKQSKIAELEDKLMIFPRPEYFKRLGEDLANFKQNLIQVFDHWYKQKEHQLQLMTSKLHGLDPKLPLERGYSVVRLKQDGTIVNKVKQLKSGTQINITVKDGSKDAQVI